MTKATTVFAFLVSLSFSASVRAQNLTWTSSTEGKYWQQKHVSWQKPGKQVQADVVIDAAQSGLTFKAWGTCFNELGYKALNMLPEAQRTDILKKLFAADGDLRFTQGRIPMNANDYALNWYSCDEVDGDFELKYFNIDRDKEHLIPFIKEAQKINPSMTFWLSPWSPPSWMKINHSYAVKSSPGLNMLSPKSDIALFEGRKEVNESVFPKQVTVNDFLIQDERYLKTYADYFCRFIEAYGQQGIPIKTVMYQNEAYSYTNYPGCAWTPEGTIKFNTRYLGPALKAKHPEVALYLGTINTNRFDLIDQILADPAMKSTINGVGFQWEGRQILPRLRAKYPDYTYVQTESECGWGSFDWKAAEHTFEIMNDYLTGGCQEYTFWNAILADDGSSGWGWKQNALIRVDSKTKTATYTPEYFAVKHYTNFVSPGSKVLSIKKAGTEGKPVTVFRTPQNKIVIVAGNLKATAQTLTVSYNGKQVTLTMQPHSLNTISS